jgi:RNA polymerase sigma factor (sigma-70 family)
MVAKTDSMARSDGPARSHPSNGLSPEEAALYQSIPANVQYVHHASFDSPSSLGPPPAPRREPESLPAWTYCFDAPQRPSAARGKTFTLDRDEEARLFLEFNHARYRLAKLQAAPPTESTIAQAREMILWYRHATDVRATLVRANLALVLTMVKRSAALHVEPDELVAEGNVVLLRCVESFDVSRGFKFSSYACRAILKCFSRLQAKAMRRRQCFPVEFDPDLERSDQAERRNEARVTSSIERLREILASDRGGLRDVERIIVLERFGIASGGQRKTLVQVARRVGLCPERVRQIQRLALEKLRLALEAERVPA